MRTFASLLILILKMEGNSGSPLGERRDAPACTDVSPLNSNEGKKNGLQGKPFNPSHIILRLQ